ncbi:hypothetical protein ADUPG1_000274 [Aduncisulcus paluster]|uniref:Uncharacterized protein n=1 Tax=Aduncisulcus paluster TaxID=2918883 RepID=A0ABQ5K664_9EUKA|nr:hypothetical protein ADUPG1_000274 [Aduncisulcus paluster]
MAKKKIVGGKILEGENRFILRLFSNFCCDPSHAIGIYNNTKHLLNGWLKALKKKRHSWGIKYFSNFVSMLSTVPSLIHLLSPKFDESMEWCKDNGGLPLDYSQYCDNCKNYLNQTKLGDLLTSIKRCLNPETTSDLYHEHRKFILSIFFASRSRGEIEEHKMELVLCYQCLKGFTHHIACGSSIFLPRIELDNLVDSFIEHLSRVEEVLGSAVHEEYCQICAINPQVQLKRGSFLDKISSTFHRILERGTQEKLDTGSIPKHLLQTLKNISTSESSSIRSSLFSLIKPYINDWMILYRDIWYYEEFIVIFANLTWSLKYDSPDKITCSELWPFFRPIFDVVKKYIVEDKIVEREYSKVLDLFSNLCCDRFHAIEIYENTKDLLDGWYEAIKKQKHDLAINFWSKLVSMFSAVTDLVPHLSPKYDVSMDWCKDNGGLESTNLKYFNNCYPHIKEFKDLTTSIYKCSDSESISKLGDLIDNIKKCPDSKSTSKLYLKHRESILSIFLSCQSGGKIEEHIKELILCFQCLRWFVHRRISIFTNLFLPISDQNDLIDTFIGHLSRVESVLEGSVDEDYCYICANYTFKVEDKRDSFFPKISPTFHRILERGSKEKLKGNVPKWLLITLRIISNSSPSTRSSIFTLIKPYAKDWMRIYGDIKYYEEWMLILRSLTLLPDNYSPNKRICSESWPFFHPILDVVKRECSGDKIVEKDYDDVLDFFSNLCCDPSHVQEIYGNIKDLLDGWYEAVKKKKHDWGILFWSKLISMLS